jgi:membrane protease YdiL (CAAX protease family)
LKKIAGLLKSYYKEEFNVRAWLLILLFAAGLTAWAYHKDFYLLTIEYENNLGKQIFRYCLMYLLAFGGGFLLQSIGERDYSVFRSGRWWFLCLFAIVLFAVRGADVPYERLFFGKVSAVYDTLAAKVAYNLGGLVLIMIPCGLYWWWQDRKDQPLYGFHSKGVTLSPYFFLLALMLPLLLWAGTQSDFLSTYPRYSHIGVSNLHPNYRWCAIGYELAYGSDFVFTEFFFRGFLILAFARKFGHKAILPMCVFYVTIHFGKPLGETISSFFGGWLLGIIALKTRSIYGGIIIHLGVAYLMELSAMLGHAGLLGAHH